ncbi:MAG: hydrogenase nickel incorporation protein HypB [Candidatus Dormibacteraeota bacterium]|nr:hydrogenase nickel incorporation protein HypB [Candidatus Dormibacteraeota bacterium]MBO0705340.1 hydrogenase nickel incorporation protein HypB [Candidatus Dormibacteraeota bacterium]MBO0762454.1 hydrogenase nickel incorporation protein HypB [Candidatus Dormibacteraeota bacterium]
MSPQTEHVPVVKSLLAGNDVVAERNRAQIAAAGVLAVNLIASPGAGKTSLILRTLEALSGDLRVGVIEGDIAGSIDAEKVQQAGAREVVQINTGGGCHLEAGMVQQALGDVSLDQLDLLFIENVGNLVCPTHWALGEQYKVCLASAAEGHDKPVKYPEIFAASDLIVLNKVDLVEHVDFDPERFYGSLHALGARGNVLELSCRTGAGLAAWVAWLREHAQAIRGQSSSPDA